MPRTFEEEAIEYFMSGALAKYRKGKKEHGQGLENVPLEQVVVEFEAEAFDTWFYSYRIKLGVNALIRRIEQLEAKVNALKAINTKLRKR